MAGRATDITGFSVLMKSEALPVDITPISVPSTGVALVAEKGAQPLMLHHFSSCQLLHFIWHPAPHLTHSSPMVVVTPLPT